jgi:NADP-reducing hydrogenase subunit HndB
MPKLTLDELKKLREEARKGIYLRDSTFRGKVIVHMGTCGIASGARQILNAFLDETSKAGISDVVITTSGCAGLCSSEPMATIEMVDSPPVKYIHLTTEKVNKILNEHIIGGRIVQEYTLGIGSEKAG